MIRQSEQFLHIQHTAPVLADIPAGDILAGGVAFLAIAVSGFLILKRSRDAKRLRNLGLSNDDVARLHYYRGVARRTQARPLGSDTPTLEDVDQS